MTRTVATVAPAFEARNLLAGAQFADAYSMTVGNPALDARRATEMMLGRTPRWIDALMTARNVVVAPFGLRTPAPGKMPDARDAIGVFPIVSETASRLVAGFDDKHLDFRVVVDVAATEDGRRVTATTLVRTHNWPGRIYLATVLPFHRVIVPSMMRQIRA